MSFEPKVPVMLSLAATIHFAVNFAEQRRGKRRFILKHQFFSMQSKWDFLLSLPSRLVCRWCMQNSPAFFGLESLKEFFSCYWSAVNRFEYSECAVVNWDCVSWEGCLYLISALALFQEHTEIKTMFCNLSGLWVGGRSWIRWRRFWRIVDLGNLR
jgi:hypothetical protein